MKVWGVVIEDVWSRAVHVDVVMDYSAAQVIVMLRKFTAKYGWPDRICSDPGSKFESAAGQIVTWWNQFKEELMDNSSVRNIEWDVLPANSPWRQGKVERRIGIIKHIL